MTITGGSALPQEDIDRMVKEAEEYAEEDRKRREAAENRNQAEALVYQTEKFLADNSEKVESLPEDVRTEVDSALAETKKVLEGADDAAIKSASDRLQTAFQSLGAAIYATAQPSSDAGATGDAAAGDTDGGSDTGGGDEDVVEAEIVDEEKKDDK